MRRVLACVPLMTVIACDIPEAHIVRPRPNLRPLPVESVFVWDSMAIGGVVSTPSCAILLSSATGGRIARVLPDGSVDSTALLGPPASFRSLRLEELRDDASLAWTRSSNGNGRVGVIDHGTLAVRWITMQPLAWGMALTGSVTGVSGELIGIAPLSDGMPIGQPKPWVPAALVSLVDVEGALAGELGTIEQRSGRYLSWWFAQSVIGAWGEKIVTLNLATGYVRTYYGNTADPSVVQGNGVDKEFSLPRYIDPPPVREEVWAPEWIQIGGEMAHLIGVPQVLSADITKWGGIVAVRPYRATWRKMSNRYLPTQGTWSVEESGIDVYLPDGELAVAYDLGDLEVGWVRIDRHDRMFLSIGSAVHVVSLDSGLGESRCPILPPEIRVTLSSDRSP